MTARMRRLAADWEQVKKDFNGHKNIIITPVGSEPPEKYNVTYFVNGIYLLPDGRIETQSRHEVEIVLHSDYPRYKPICKILTPIWHPNFRDGQICIGDIWGAGESLSDIIINIGDMIQYKSWNSYSPLSADAAQWAIENKHIFPVGTVNLYVADYASAKDTVNIDIIDSDNTLVANDEQENIIGSESVVSAPVAIDEDVQTNDFDIFAEELSEIEFIPTAERMQTVSHGGMVKGNKINLKTILVKGLIWAFIGAFLGFGISELTDGLTSNEKIANALGHEYLAQYYSYTEQSLLVLEDVMYEFEEYAKENDISTEDDGAMLSWLLSMPHVYESILSDFLDISEDASNALEKSVENEFNNSERKLDSSMANISRLGTAFWSAFIALFIGLFLGIGEGVFYGSKEKAIKYALTGAAISIAIGFISGYLAQWMYAEMLNDNSSDMTSAFVRGLGWALMGLGIGAAVGLIKPELKRIIFCSVGGLVGAFVGGFLFNYIVALIPNDMVARGIAIVIMGSLIGLGVGLLEQFAKQAWLKVIRGEFEGKEYLVFAGTTSIGNSGKNTIVLFKDKLVAPHHCDIVLEGSKYILVDSGTSSGTVVNGNKATRHQLKQGDAIAVGNSVLVFNVK